jgi:N-hydroxyarylamine O-acetyltransferase
VFDLNSYMRRVGLDGRDPRLAEIHRAHVTSIPFESLEAQRATGVSLQEGDLVAKLLRRRRGGYCFEQNLLLRAALQALGAEVELYLARVLLGADPAAPRARSHLLLGVRWEGEHFHADAGFGGGTLLEPLPWGLGEEHEQAGWRYRVTRRDGELVLQSAGAEGWQDLYAFLDHPVLMPDIETVNWWTSTNPASRFVSGFLVSRQWQDGRRLAMSDWGELVLIQTTPAGQRTEPLRREQVPGLLAERFGLEGFALGPDGRLVGPG